MAINREILRSVGKDPRSDQARGAFFLKAFLSFLERDGFRDSPVKSKPIEVSTEVQSALGKVNVLTAGELAPGRYVVIFSDEEKAKMAEKDD